MAQIRQRGITSEVLKNSLIMPSTHFPRITAGMFTSQLFFSTNCVWFSGVQLATLEKRHFTYKGRKKRGKKGVFFLFGG